MKLKKDFYKGNDGWYLEINDDSIPLRRFIIGYWKKMTPSYFIRKHELCFWKLRIIYSKLPF